jgi:hypothetical protein
MARLYRECCQRCGTPVWRLRSRRVAYGLPLALGSTIAQAVGSLARLQAGLERTGRPRLERIGPVTRGVVEEEIARTKRELRALRALQRQLVGKRGGNA